MASPIGDVEVLWRVLEITRRLAVTVELKPLLEDVTAAAREVLHAERTSILLHDAGTGELVAVVATGGVPIRFPDNKGIAGECVRTRQAINVPDCYTDPRFNRDIDRHTGYHTRCLMSVPLIGLEAHLVGVLQVMNKPQGVFTAEEVALAEVFASQCAVALQRALLLEEQQVKRKLEQDLAVARDIQTRVSPTQLPQLPGCEMAAWYRSADQTGGDIYDVAALSAERCAFLLGDATGHGMGPALSVTQVRAMFRMALRLNAGLETAVSQVNAQLAADLPSDRFVTAIVGVLDAPTGGITYIAAGQAPLLHVHTTACRISSYAASAPPLGVLDTLLVLVPETLTLMPGDILALFSDGFFEARAPGGETYGEARVQAWLLESRSQPLDQIIAGLRDAVDAFREGTPQTDDMTALLFRHCGHG